MIQIRNRLQVCHRRFQFSARSCLTIQVVSSSFSSSWNQYHAWSGRLKARGPELPVPNLFVGIHQTNQLATADQLDAPDAVVLVDSPLFKIVGKGEDVHAFVAQPAEVLVGPSGMIYANAPNLEGRAFL